MRQINKNILLVFGFVIALIFCYSISIKKTIALKKEVTHLNESLSVFNQSFKKTTDLRAKETFLDSVLKANNLQNNSIQNKMLEILNSKAEEKGFLISEFNEPHKILEENATINSYSFKLQGSFQDLLEVIYFFEQETNLGKLTHVKFEKKYDYKKGKHHLNCFVVIDELISL